MFRGLRRSAPAREKRGCDFCGGVLRPTDEDRIEFTKMPVIQEGELVGEVVLAVCPSCWAHWLAVPAED